MASDWQGPVVLEDLAPKCCTAHGVKVSSNRPCFLLRNVLSRAECAAIVASVASKHADKPESFEPGARSQFGLVDEELRQKIWGRVSEYFPSALDGGECVGFQSEWRHARYFPGQSVMAHMDFRHGERKELAPSSDSIVASRISFTLYLNDDGFSGGETAFVTDIRMDGTHGGIFHPNVPETGSAICFYQCVPEFSHTAETVRDGFKSIMRADVMYRFATNEQADLGGQCIPPID